MNKQNRRNFIKSLCLGTASAPLAARHVLSQKEDRITKDKMVYRRLGRTGLYVSEMSLGGSPLPDWAILREAVDRGINYIDTSHSYENGNSERKIAKLFKEVGRDKLYVHTRFHLRGNWTEDSLLDIVAGSLKRLDTDYIDILGVHGARNPDDLTDERVLNVFEKLKKEGKYRFKGLTCHSNLKEIVDKVVECGYYDMMNLSYNAFDIDEGQQDIKIYDDYLGASGTRDMIRLLKSKDIGIVAQKTLKIGGKQQNLDTYKTGTTSIQQAMLKWVLDNPNISAVITEILTYEQLEEDLNVVDNPLSPAERANLYRLVSERSKDYCHMCGSCQKVCPSQIKTTDIQRYLAYHESYNKTERARLSYSRLNPSQTSLACQNCGDCEKACPYGVSVRNRLKTAHCMLQS